MQITVKLFAGLRQGRFVTEEFVFADGVTIAQIIEEHKIPGAEVGVLLCNGRHTDFSRKLEDGDVVSIFPKVGGG
jgi:molybdopterin converting factor small subunit